MIDTISYVKAPLRVAVYVSAMPVGTVLRVYRVRGTNARFEGRINWNVTEARQREAAVTESRPVNKSAFLAHSRRYCMNLINNTQRGEGKRGQKALYPRCNFTCEAGPMRF